MKKTDATWYDVLGKESATALMGVVRAADRMDDGDDAGQEVCGLGRGDVGQVPDGDAVGVVEDEYLADVGFFDLAVETAAEEDVPGADFVARRIGADPKGEVVGGYEVERLAEGRRRDRAGISSEESGDVFLGVYVRALVPSGHVHAALPGQQPRLGDVLFIGAGEPAQEAVGEFACHAFQRIRYAAFGHAQSVGNVLLFVNHANSLKVVYRRAKALKLYCTIFHS